MSGDAGKGSTPRPVDLKKFGDSMDRIFGKREPSHYQRGNHALPLPKEIEIPMREPRSYQDIVNHLKAQGVKVG